MQGFQGHEPCSWCSCVIKALGMAIAVCTLQAGVGPSVAAVQQAEMAAEQGQCSYDCISDLQSTWAHMLLHLPSNTLLIPIHAWSS
jgi:hypothetical protein